MNLLRNKGTQTVRHSMVLPKKEISETTKVSAEWRTFAISTYLGAAWRDAESPCSSAVSLMMSSFSLSISSMALYNSSDRPCDMRVGDGNGKTK